MAKLTKYQQHQALAKVVFLTKEDFSVSAACRDVAEEFGVTPTRVYEIYRDHHPREIGPDHKHYTILTAKAAGRDAKSIAAEHGCSVNTVHKVCRHFRLPTRDA